MKCLRRLLQKDLEILLVIATMKWYDVACARYGDIQTMYIDILSDNSIELNQANVINLT